MGCHLKGVAEASGQQGKKGKAAAAHQDHQQHRQHRQKCHSEGLRRPSLHMRSNFLEGAHKKIERPAQIDRHKQRDEEYKQADKTGQKRQWDRQTDQIGTYIETNGQGGWTDGFVVFN